MQTLFPDYYPRFHCIADRCRHSCCIGWEIDIDAASFARYQTESGPLREKLRRCISTEGCPHFILAKDERCPFLNEQNLCELILEKGDGALCDICREHPRFYNTLAGRREAGLGLCCEAAASLILGRKEPVRLYTEGESAPTDADPFEGELFAVREKAFSVLQDRRFSMKERLRRFADAFSLSISARSPAAWAAFFSSLEQLSPDWGRELAVLSRCEKFTLRPLPQLEVPLEQLCVYLVYRHLPAAQSAEEIKAYLAFALLSCQILWQLSVCKEEAGGCSFADFAELCRLYSSEIEYAEDNTFALLELLFEANEPL